MLDPKLLEESRQNVEELSTQLNQKEKELKEKVNELKNSVKEVKDLRNTINKNEEEFRQKLEKQKTEYEKKLARQKEPLTPQELKAIGDALEEIDKETFKSENYEELLEKLKARKQKYKEIAENNRVKPNKRYFYEKLSESVDYRIDFMRIVIGEPIDTDKGKDILEKIRRANMGRLARFWDNMRRNKATTAQIIIGILQGIFTIVYSCLQWTADKALKGGKDVVLPAVIQTGASVGINTAKDLILAIPKTLLWMADNITQFIIGAISVSLFLYKEYGEEASFPILAFWAYILAMGMFALHYVKSIYEKVKSYVPFTGDSS